MNPTKKEHNFNKVKRIPVKGLAEVKKKPLNCSKCGKPKSLINKSKKLCDYCNKLVLADLAKIRKERDKEKKAKNRLSKARSPAKLTAKLDAIFSIFIRLRGTDEEGNATCFTCGLVKPWRNLQNGHFCSRRFKTVRYHEKNCDVQCYGCNVGLAGLQYEFGINLDKKYGPGTAEEMIQLSKVSYKFSAEEMEDLITVYEEKVLRLRKEKNLWN